MTPPPAPRIVVVAAVIEENGAFLVARRLPGTHLAGYWEFPGGKVTDGEALEAGLAREIREELNAGIAGLQKILETAHTYPERTVELHFYRGSLTERPVPALGQELRWITRDEFASLEFPPADQELIAQLTHLRV
jgi:8-oxo-dGTP diphosphatase